MICGEFDNLETCQIFVNESTYTLPNPLELINCCFKIYFSLKVDYAVECRHIWYFIQHFIFNIDIDKVQNFAAVNALTGRIQQELKKVN